MSIAPPGWETPPAPGEPDPVDPQDAKAKSGIAKAKYAVAGARGAIAAAQAAVDKVTDSVEKATGASAKPKPGAVSPKESVARVRESFAKAKRSTSNPSARGDRPWYLTYSWIAGLILVLAIVAAAESQSGSPGSESATPAQTAQSPQSQESVAQAPSEAPAPDVVESDASAGDSILTADNSTQFAALLKMDYCDRRIKAFAVENAGRTIQFDGSIVNMQNHGNYSTRYDLLIAPGNKGPESTVGPAFKFEDVNVISDLNYTGKPPELVGAGDRFRFVAEVGEYNQSQCLFFLDPVSTKIR